jgi:hypothetical protein
MNTNTNFPKEVLFQLALELNDKDIINLCLSSKRANDSICNNERFWKLKLRKEYPEIKTLYFPKLDASIYIKLKKTLRNIENTTFEKHVRIGAGFESPVFVKPAMKEFLLNTNFGNIDGIPINYYLYPLLKQNIMNRVIITILLAKYFRKLETFQENGRTYFKVDGHINSYLHEYLDEIEKEDSLKPQKQDSRGMNIPKFNRNKFLMNRIQSIGQKGIIIPTLEERLAISDKIRALQFLRSKIELKTYLE